jgi:imidazolonepropionase
MSKLGLIEQGAVAIDSVQGTIVFAGPVSALPRDQLAPSCRLVDASGKVVMPGFVDSHTHLVFAGTRADEFYRRARGETYQEIARGGGGIIKTVQATRQATEDELYASAVGRLWQLYSNGTTAVESKSGYGLERDTELKCLRVNRRLAQDSPGLVFSTLMAAHVVPPEYTERRGAYLELVRDLTGEVTALGVADFHDVFVDPLAFTVDEAAQISSQGRWAGLRLKLHADEFGDDGTAAWGVAENALSIDHLAGIGDGGIAAMAAGESVATLLPATMFFSRTGMFAPARRMIDAGCPVALATDLNPGSSLVYSMPFVMSLAVLHMGMSAEECICASTINAAYALDAAGQIGSLEAGKRADVIVVDVPDYEEIAYHVGADLIRDSIIAGKFVKRDGRMVPANSNI